MECIISRSFRFLFFSNTQIWNLYGDGHRSFLHSCCFIVAIETCTRCLAYEDKTMWNTNRNSGIASGHHMCRGVPDFEFRLRGVADYPDPRIFRNPRIRIPSKSVFFKSAELRIIRIFEIWNPRIRNPLKSAGIRQNPADFSGFKIRGFQISKIYKSLYTLFIKKCHKKSFKQAKISIFSQNDYF